MAASLSPSGFFVLRAPWLLLEELDRLRADPEYWRSLQPNPLARRQRAASPAFSPCDGNDLDVRESRYRRLVITPAQRAGRTEEQWQLVTTATEELVSRVVALAHGRAQSTSRPTLFGCGV
jgi:hypothetical protein